MKLSRSKIKSYLWPKPLWRRILMVFLAVLILFLAASYGVAQWYIARHNDEPLKFGTTFTSDYATSFGLDSKETLATLLGDLKLKQVRLVSYWDRIEQTPGNYDFT